MGLYSEEGEAAGQGYDPAMLTDPFIEKLRALINYLNESMRDAETEELNDWDVRNYVLSWWENQFGPSGPAYKQSPKKDQEH